MSASPIPSATVLLVRDRPGFEVLMVRRHHQVDFASGALVFPGGKVDPQDRHEGWLPHLHGAEGLPAEERALRLCAVREAYEETGILLARHANDAAFEIGPRAAEARARVAAGDLAIRDLVVSLGLRIEIGTLVPFAHWITPAPMPKRFDTRFYLMTAPADQIAACDGYETVDAEWLAPDEALRLEAAGERTIVFATRLNLALLARSTSVADAMASAAARPVVPVEPILEKTPEGAFVSIPADAGYGAVERQPV